MDEETRKAFQTINNKLFDIEKSCLHSESEILELKSQVGINCSKLDKMDNKLDQVKEIGEKNQNSINELIKLNRQNI